VSNPAPRAGTCSRLLVIVILLAAALLAVGLRPASAASMKVPSGLEAAARTSTTLTMTWKAVSKAPGYRLQYSTSSSMKKAKYQRDGDTTSTLKGLKPGQTYYVKVRVISKSGGNLSSYSKAVKIKTLTKDPLPSAPDTPPTPTPTPTPPVTPVPTPTPAPTTPAPTSTPAPTPTPSATPTATPTVPPVRLNLPLQPDVLLVGDSYTEGVGAEPISNGYAFKVAEPLGWTLTRDGRGGSGYVNPTTYGAGIFAERLPRHPTDAYDLVVLQGSSNDVRYGNAELDANLDATLQIVRDRYPRAQVLMVGPTNPYGNPSPDLLRVNGEVKAAAAAWGVPFIDPLAESWFVPGDGRWAANPANGHPSNAGYQRIADRFVAGVRALS